MKSATSRETREFWSHLWKQGHTVWQQPGVHKLLINNKETLLRGKRGARVFLPLCGKAHELRWFYDMGHNVIGVEFVEECVRSYFNDCGLQIEEATCPIIKCKIFR
ncbi:hypothetical protein MRX96_059925, partial [Rhipicephalus microplus]